MTANQPTKAGENRLEQKHMVARDIKVRAPRKREVGPRPIHGPNGNKLKQVRYYQFQNAIAIYHYQASFISFKQFRSLLTRKDHGYVWALRSNDPFCKVPVPPGDEVPATYIEVGYLANVFQRGGSALGFRMGGDVVEWLCFDKDIKTLLLDRLDVNTSTARMLFDHVADIERAAFTSRASKKLLYTDHKDWYDALERAVRVPLDFALSWRTFGTELKKEHLRRREAAGLSASTDVEVGQIGRGVEVRQTCQRDTDSPDTIGRNTPVYRDPVLNQHFASLQSSKSNRSRSSSSTSALSDRSTNTPRKQPAPSAAKKAKEELLLEGKYI
jgi:hypothetical protein